MSGRPGALLAAAVLSVTAAWLLASPASASTPAEKTVVTHSASVIAPAGPAAAAPTAGFQASWHFKGYYDTLETCTGFWGRGAYEGEYPIDPASGCWRSEGHGYYFYYWA